MNKIQLITLISMLIINGVVLADSNKGLVAHWSFDDCNAVDSTGHGFDGAIIGSPQCVTGNSGQALQFDGIKDYIDLGNKKLFSSGDSVTIVAWVNAKDIKSTYWSPILSKWSYEIDKSEWSLGFNYGNLFFLESADLACNCLDVGSNKFNDVQDKWSLVGIQISGNTVSYIKNGKIIDKDTNNYQFIDTDVHLKIGASNENLYFFKGIIDDLRVYNRLLTSSELSEIYNVGVSVNGKIGSLGSHTIMCKNETTGQVINIASSKATTYDCEAKGLKVNTGETASIFIKGVVQ